MIILYVYLITLLILFSTFKSMLEFTAWFSGLHKWVAKAILQSHYICWLENLWNFPNSKWGQILQIGRGRGLINPGSRWRRRDLLMLFCCSLRVCHFLGHYRFRTVWELVVLLMRMAYKIRNQMFTIASLCFVNNCTMKQWDRLGFPRILNYKYHASSKSPKPFKLKKLNSTQN